MKTLLIILSSVLIIGCGEKSEKKSEAEKPSEEKPKKDPPADGSLCYRYTDACGDGASAELVCNLTMTINGNKVKANVFCEGCEGNGETFYEGEKHEDTLILNETSTEPDGKTIVTKTFWIMAGDQLNQLVTTQRNGETILKEQATHTFLTSYMKVECE